LAGEGDGMTRHLGGAGDRGEWLEVAAATREGEEESHGYVLQLIT
jgi:hypothetical protein